MKDIVWKSDLPGVIVLGSGTLTLSVVRSLGRRGIRTCVINKRKSAENIHRSRYCHTFLSIPEEEDVQKYWAHYLMSNESRRFHGHILLACGDHAIEVLINNRERLEKKYILDIMDKSAQICALNKHLTYQSALAAGVSVPKFALFPYDERDAQYGHKVPFPLIVKPVYSHKFPKNYGGKYLLAKNSNELNEAFYKIRSYKDDVILSEFVDGPDSQLCDYYTYIDEEGKPLFNFTKRIIRRYPIHGGFGCYHITDQVNEIRDLSLLFLEKIRLRGLANVQFKRDSKDGNLKLIECNARFTAANCLIAKSGLDLAFFVYSRLAGIPHEIPDSFLLGKRLWYPLADFRTFLELRRRGQLTFWGWLKSVMHPQIFPYFAWDDPLPSVAMNVESLKKLLFKMGGRIRHIRN